VNKIKCIFCRLKFIVNHEKKPTYKQYMKKFRKLEKKGMTIPQIVAETAKKWTYVWNPNGEKYT